MSSRPLSKAQKTQIGILGTAAWKHQSDLGQVETPGDLATASKTDRMKFWIHQQIADVTQRVCSASDMMDSEYRAVKTRFELLAGQPDKAYDTAHRDAQDAACHRDPGCEYVRQMHHWMVKAGCNTGYMIAIMKAKFRGCSELTRLSEGQLKQLHDTILNRCRKKLGLGDEMTQNKKQRHARTLKKQAATAPGDEAAPAPQPSRERTYILKPAPALRQAPQPPAAEADPF